MRLGNKSGLKYVYVLVTFVVLALILTAFISCRSSGGGAKTFTSKVDGGSIVGACGSTPDSGNIADPELLASLKDELIRQLDARLADSGECLVLGTPDTVNDIVPKTGRCTECKGDTPDSGECPVLGTPETVNDIVPKTGYCTDLKSDNPASGECLVLGTPETVNDLVPKTGYCTECKGDNPASGECLVLGTPDDSDYAPRTGRCTDDYFSLIGSKFKSSAPSGDSGRVTDLAYDTDTHTLSWTYANLADYDGNGEVGVPDITPIANNFLANTTDGSGNDALESWIDGDKNGEVGVPDVTPIANNYLARVDGYRVYRKAPGETEFSLLPDPDDAGSPLTIPHEDVFPAGSPDTLIPIQYAFADEVQGDTGIVSYYVAGYDTKDEEKSEPSNMINIDLSTGQVNAAPVAKLVVDTDYGGAPLTVTFDASGSVDSDGTIEEYRFDFDGDGVIDYSSDDAAPPTESSGGTVTEITPGASPWLVSATFSQCSSDYYYPSVKAMDDDGALSLAGYSKIGVTGWVNEMITSESVSTVEFYIYGMDFDPTTGELVVAGTYSGDFDFGITEGMYFSRLRSNGTWEKELVMALDAPEWHYDDEHTYGGMNTIKIGWTTDGRPIIVGKACEMGWTPVYRMICLERLSSGEWIMDDGSNGGANEPLFPRLASFGSNCDAEKSPSDFVMLYTDYQDFGKRYGLLWYENGTWSVEDTGYIFTTDFALKYPNYDRNGILHVTVRNRAIDLCGVWIYTRNGVGDWLEEQVTDSSMAEGSLGMGANGLLYTPDNKARLLLIRGYGDSNPYLRNISLVTSTESGIEETQIAKTNGWTTSILKADVTGVSIFYDDIPGNGIQQILYQTRIEGTEQIDESIFTIPESLGSNGASIDQAVTSDDGREYIYINGSGGEYGQDWRMLSHRVDPKVNQ